MYYDVSKHEEWYGRLVRWQEALKSYQERVRKDPKTLSLAVCDASTHLVNGRLSPFLSRSIGPPSPTRTNEKSHPWRLLRPGHSMIGIKCRRQLRCYDSVDVSDFLSNNMPAYRAGNMLGNLRTLIIGFPGHLWVARLSA